MSLQLNINGQDPENNEYLQIWENFGFRPSKLTLYIGVSSTDIWKVLKQDSKTTIKFSEVFKRGEDLLVNARYLVEREEKSLYVSFVELAEEDPNVNTLHFYYDSKKHDHDDLLKKLYDEFKPYIKEFTEDVVASKENFFVVNYAKENYETIQTQIEPIKLDVELNYNSLFSKMESLLEILNSSKSGIITFYGPRGSGKTHFLRHIIPQIKKYFYYFPTYLLENTWIFNHFLNNIKKQKGAILILEDSEGYFCQSNRGSKQHIEAILSCVESLTKSNDLQVLLILNVDQEDMIEEDIINSNSVIFEHFFEPLNSDQANKLAKKLKNKMKFEEPVVLANVYSVKKMPPIEKRKPGYKN